MLKLSHASLVFISGIVWLVIGTMLLSMGLNFLIESILRDNLLTMKRPILDTLAAIAGDFDSAVIALIVAALLVGYFKGRFVLAKTVAKSVDRIKSLSNPASLAQIYAKKYYFLLAFMMSLGLIAKLLPMDIRGAIDVTIGAALINGAVLYFRSSYALYRSQNEPA